MPQDTCNFPVAYFCAEYGLQVDLPLYAGGLGVLAGDTVKEAADQGLGMVAVGLLYRGVNYIQELDENNWQVEKNYTIDPVKSGFEHVYTLENEEQPLFIKINLSNTNVWCRVWKKSFANHMVLYLLDTDTEQNEPEIRDVTHALYFGSEDVVIKQQLILGLGGAKLLMKLGIEPCIYHVNEGRPAFLYWELVRHLMHKQQLSYEQAAQKAKSMIVYTNHTLVRAGNQSYNIDILKNYLGFYADKLGLTTEQMLEPGLDDAAGGKFNMTLFALNTSHKASAVSQPHAELSKAQWPEFSWVGITNGVHMPTWQKREILEAKDDPSQLWQVHNRFKSELAEFVQGRTGYGYDPNRLVITWARRIASYKRPNSIFADMDRLKAILHNADRPVQILMAGKAHASDNGAKTILQLMLSQMSELDGHVIYVPNYNFEVAGYFVSGSDVWLNTPMLGQEASGTSGMKAIANGVLQLTCEDGWAAEVDWHDQGWSLDGNHLVETLYFRLEEDVVPMFYNRNSEGIPEDWVERMQKSIKLSEHYSTTRMLNEYQSRLYNLD